MISFLAIFGCWFLGFFFSAILVLPAVAVRQIKNVAGAAGEIRGA